MLDIAAALNPECAAVGVRAARGRSVEGQAVAAENDVFARKIDAVAVRINTDNGNAELIHAAGNGNLKRQLNNHRITDAGTAFRRLHRRLLGKADEDAILCRSVVIGDVDDEFLVRAYLPAARQAGRGVSQPEGRGFAVVILAVINGRDLHGGTALTRGNDENAGESGAAVCQG